MITRFTTIVVTIIALSFVLLGATLTYDAFDRLDQQMLEFRSGLLEKQRRILRKEVERTIEYLESQHAQVESVARKKLKERVYRAQAIADNLRSVYGETLDDNHILRMLIAVLRPQRFEGNGYYFLTDFSGVSRMNPNRPELEGENLLGKKNSRGMDLVREFISIAKDQGEGFQRYYFRKPGGDCRKEHCKIAFIKHLEPYAMYIGTGVYLEDLENEVREGLRSYLKSYRFGYRDSGYVFIIKVKNLDGGDHFGTMFVNANRPDLEGKDLSDKVPDARGKLFRREFLKGLREKGECYVKYWYKKFDQPEPEPKLTFFKLYQAGGLIVAAGSYLPDNEILIARQRRKLINRLKRNLLPLLVVLTIISVMMLLLARWWTRKSGAEFDRFKKFFSRAAVHGEKLKVEEFRFQEMRDLATTTNQMLAERDELDRRLREREELFRTLTETSPIGIFIYQKEVFIYANRATSEISGYSNEELIGMPFWEFVHPEMRDLVRRRGLSRQQGGSDLPQSYKFKIICKNGEEKWLIFSSARIDYQGEPAALGNVLDVTEQVAAEEALAIEREKNLREMEKMHKMEAIGLLAGGIAHDFNNLLTAIYGNISMAVMQLQKTKPDLDKVRNNLAAADLSSSRAQELTSQLLTFAKGGEPVKELVDIEAIIRETAEFFLSGSNVRLKFDFAPDLKGLEVDKGQFCQVINNLVVNADQAMPEGGTLTIRAENVIDDDLGPAVRITVVDEGVGIPPKYLEKICEPYFTTKAKGSGLGLATVHSIVTRHGGRLQVTSEISRGSCFAITLPATDKKQEAKGQRSGIVKGSGRILVMDDEEVVRAVCVEFLENLGYEVEGVADGREMLDLYRRNLSQGKAFDLVIMDLTIPGGMGGKEAIAALLKIDSAARAIVCSGYSQDPVMANFREYGFQGTCAKPFDLVVLSQMVKKVIGLKL
ncbi:MAG: PAS domain S-box protein [Deltaproteobacteria bacterium]|nr:PAS domain S-box protein [Deltaproteobacteria bacterium]